MVRKRKRLREAMKTYYPDWWETRFGDKKAEALREAYKRTAALHKQLMISKEDGGRMSPYRRSIETRISRGREELKLFGVLVAHKVKTGGVTTWKEVYY